MNKKARTGVLRSNKPQKKAHNHHIIQSYCVLFKKAGMPHRKCMLHSAKDCMCASANRTIKGGMVVSVGSSTDTVKQYKKSENKWKKELKALKKQKNMLYSIAKKSRLRREIRTIQAKSSKKGRHSSSVSPSDDSDSDS